jgi:hypothetical protein
MDDGKVVADFFARIDTDLAASAGDAGEVAAAVGQALALLRGATAALKDAGAEEASGAAVDYLRLFALVAMGWMWARMAAVPGDTPQHTAKRAVAQFYVRRILPRRKVWRRALPGRRRCSCCPPRHSDPSENSS